MSLSYRLVASLTEDPFPGRMAHVIVFNCSQHTGIARVLNQTPGIEVNFFEIVKLSSYVRSSITRSILIST